MTIEKGAILEGKVINITNFGAFIDLEGKTGLVHISEVSNTYVKDINEVLKAGDVVKVKVLNIEPAGKISLSIKATMVENKENTNNFKEKFKKGIENNSKVRDNVEHSPYSTRKTADNTKGPQKFEDMLNRFTKDTEEKMAEYRRRSEGFGNKKRRS